MPSVCLLVLYWTRNWEWYSRGCKSSVCLCDGHAEGSRRCRSIRWLVTESVTQPRRKIRLTWCVLCKLVLPGRSGHWIIFRWPQIDHLNNLFWYLSGYWQYLGQHLPLSHDPLCFLHSTSVPRCLWFFLFCIFLPSLSAPVPSGTQKVAPSIGT